MTNTVIVQVRFTPLPSLVAQILFLGLMMSGASAVWGQDFPVKPIRIVTAEAGTNADLTARVISQKVSGTLGQQVVVDNRGGSVTIAAQIVSKALPDGYTLFVTGNSFWLFPLLQDAPFDPAREFLPVTMTNRAPNVLVVHPSVPATSVKELIALAKAKPGALDYGSGLTGAINHLAAELFNSMAGVNIVHIPYKGSATAVTALLGGEVRLIFSAAGPTAPHVKSGRLRALAVTSAQPSALAPGLPTVAASGLPGYEAEALTAIFAPAKTPATRINRLNREFVRVLNEAESKERFFSAGMDVVASSPEQCVAMVSSEITKWGKVIKDRGIRSK